MADKHKPQDGKPQPEKRGGWLSRFAPGVRKIVTRRDTPDNLWVKDPDSGEMLFRADLETSLWVTPSGRHVRIGAQDRLLRSPADTGGPRGSAEVLGWQALSRTAGRRP